jgi:uncharacterized protein
MHTSPQRANEHCGRRHDGLLLAGVSTLIAVPSFAALRLLGQLPSHGPASPPASDVPSTAPTVGTHRRSMRFVAFFITTYRRSYLHVYLHRNRGHCRFVPCCAEYALLAVEKYGLLRGVLLAGRRIARCNPALQGDYLDFP